MSEMTIAKETTQRINEIINTSDLEVSVERKKLYVLGEIAVLLAGLLDAHLLEYEVEDED